MGMVHKMATVATATWTYVPLTMPKCHLVKIIYNWDSQTSYLQSKLYIGTFTTDPLTKAPLVDLIMMGLLTATYVGISFYKIPNTTYCDFDLENEKLTWVLYQVTGGNKNYSITLWYR